MPDTPPDAVKETKGARTARRILDVAEDLFARHGYDGTSLRQIARGAGIKEPGLYNHFASKQALYEAVLFRALNPMSEALSQHMRQATQLHDYTELPAIMTDLLLEHPQMAALFQQALQGSEESLSNRLVGHWLERLLQQGMASLEHIGAPDPDGGMGDARAALAINLIAMFNLTTGYFLAQRAFDTLASGSLTDPVNIARQKRLLHRVIRAMLVS
jgi:AcrR family transcriptional regulator